MRRPVLARWFGVGFCLALLGSYGLGFEILIDVSPKTLNLQSEGEVVTVHTNIGYGEVNVYSVFLNEIAIDSWKADNRGNFVAKFEMDVIKTLNGLVIDDFNTLTLVGQTKNGEAFSGSMDIMVIDVEQKGRK